MPKEEKKKGLELLREPFPENQISLLPRATTKDGKKAKCNECSGYHAFPSIHLKYVGHAALTDRLLDADPNWSWEPMTLKEGLPGFDTNGGLWIKLTVCGVTRLGYGNATNSQYKEIGSREKEVIGDALRNAAMRFGAALDLWHKGELHVDHEEEAPKAKKETPSENPISKENPTCKTCNSVMLLSKNGQHFYCNSWRDGRDHKTIKVTKPKEKEVEEIPFLEEGLEDLPMFDDFPDKP